MGGSRKEDEQFNPEETRKRMEAAMRGARIAGHKPMSAIKAKPKSGKSPAKRRAKKR
jgi:hypothetical protein